MPALFVFAVAALLEIAGCFAFWAWWRQGVSVFWLLPALAALAGFAFLLAQSPSDAAGRSFAIYGGVYITASLLWLWLVERLPPDWFDLAGAALCLAGAAVILYAPRG